MISKKVSDEEIDLVSDEIYDLLRTFDSPKDAVSALSLAHYKLLVASFKPENHADAVRAVEAEATLIKAMLTEGWN